MPDATTNNQTPHGHGASAPFLLRLERRPERGSHFAPAAVLLLTPALRASGLWRALPPDRFKDLLLLLTFLAPEGRVQPTIVELAEAMGVSAAKARARLGRLIAFQWQGEPLVREIPRGGGLDAFTPAPALVAVSDAPVGLPGPEYGHSHAGADIGIRPAGREAVLEHSRARYAREREEVEADIARRMGWAPPEFAGDTPAVAARKQAAYQALTGLGVPREQALDLLARFALDAIEAQIRFLPHRNAKAPARLLAAAIEGGYAPPAALRRPADHDPDRAVAAGDATPAVPETDVGDPELPEEYQPPEEHALEDLEWDLTQTDLAGEDTGAGEDGSW